MVFITIGYGTSSSLAVTLGFGSAVRGHIFFYKWVCVEVEFGTEFFVISNRYVVARSLTVVMSRSS